MREEVKKNVDYILRIGDPEQRLETAIFRKFRNTCQSFSGCCGARAFLSRRPVGLNVELNNKLIDFSKIDFSGVDKCYTVTPFTVEMSKDIYVNGTYLELTNGAGESYPKDLDWSSPITKPEDIIISDDFYQMSIVTMGTYCLSPYGVFNWQRSGLSPRATFIAISPEEREEIIEYIKAAIKGKYIFTVVKYGTNHDYYNSFYDLMGLEILFKSNLFYNPGYPGYYDNTLQFAILKG